jgi:hypothetical protein
LTGPARHMPADTCLPRAGRGRQVSGHMRAARRCGVWAGAVGCGEDGWSLPGGFSASILSLLACRTTVQLDGLQYACCVTGEDSNLNGMPCTWTIELNSAAPPPHLSQRPTPKKLIAIRNFQLKIELLCRRWKHFAITVCLAESFSCWTLIYDSCSFTPLAPA